MISWKFFGYGFIASSLNLHRPLRVYTWDTGRASAVHVRPFCDHATCHTYIAVAIPPPARRCSLDLEFERARPAGAAECHLDDRTGMGRREAATPTKGHSCFGCFCRETGRRILMLILHHK